jgi:hypothetical protein
MVADPGDADYAWSFLHKDLSTQNFPDSNPYAVPTCVAQGRDGALHIGQLTALGNGPPPPTSTSSSPEPGR